MYDSPTLDCQACGTVLRRLTTQEAQQVADNPYNYVWFCTPCKQAFLHVSEEYLHAEGCS